VTHRSSAGFNFVPETGLWLSDNTIGDASTSRHGFMKKLPNDATKYYDGTGVFSTPSGSPGGGIVDYMYPYADAIDDPVNDNFREGDGAGGMDTSGTRFSGAGAWTAENSPTTTVVGDGRAWVTSAASASIQLRGYYQAVPSGNWCIRAAVAIRPGGNDTSEKAVGMYLRESATGKIEWWGFGYSGGAQIVWADKLTNATTHSAVRASNSVGSINWPTHLEIEYNGTNYYFRAIWGDRPGTLVAAGYSFAKANFFTTAADGIGIFSENDQSVATTLIATGFYRVPVSSVL